MNSDVFIESIASKSIRLYPVTKYFNLMKKMNISIEKIRNSGNYIYDYAHSFFGEDF